MSNVRWVSVGPGPAKLAFRRLILPTLLAMHLFQHGLVVLVAGQRQSRGSSPPVGLPPIAVRLAGALGAVTTSTLSLPLTGARSIPGTA